MPAVGHHEVIIESRTHEDDLSLAGGAQVRAVVEAYRARYRALATVPGGVVVIFRNHGARAGTSQSHPHSQIIATPVVPIEIRHRYDVAIRHYDDNGTSLYSDALSAELDDGRRIVYAGERLVAFQPFASTVPHETWITPRAGAASFGLADDATLDEFAITLRAVLAGLRSVLADPAYNLVVYSAPIGDEDQAYFVWHCRIVPRLSTTAGFELGTGMRINPSTPEQTASVLRQVVAPSDGR